MNYKYIIQDLINWKLRINFFLLRIFFPSKLKCKDKKRNSNILFEDNFEVIDKKVWSFNPGWGTYHPGSIVNKGEAPLIYWNPDGSAVRSEEGKMVLDCIEKPTTIIHEGKEYTIPFQVGYACTSNSFQFKYGYVEVSCMIPKGRGYWPAFWFGFNEDWPPEIDVFEFYTDKKWYNIFNGKQTLMKIGYYIGSKEKIIRRKMGIFRHSVLNVRNGHVFLPKFITSTYNKYGMKWNEEGIFIYFNDVLVWQDTIDSKHESLHKFKAHIILNHGISNNTKIKDITRPITPFKIDYVRVYEN